jgi:3-deoxy-D-manno-octulosonate 8-phosphate phosphatase (KDO 8-P phosphatase)
MHEEQDFFLFPPEVHLVRIPVWQQARAIRLLAMDVDGVLTDGRIMLDPQGHELKCFHVHDGQGIALAQRAGLPIAWISGRASTAVQQRATELKVPWVYQQVADKVHVLQELLTHTGLSAAVVAYIGDDLGDVPVLRRVGLPIAVANALPEVRACAAWVTQRAGGQGAVREVIDLVLRAQGRWTAAVQDYLHS